MAFLLALGAVLGLATVAADSLKFPCTGATYQVVGAPLATANVDCQSGECQLEKGLLTENAIKDYQNAIFLSITPNSENFTLANNRYVFFVNCSSGPVDVHVGASTTTVATGKALYKSNTSGADQTFSFDD